MVEDRPVSAFTLALIGLVLQMLAAVFLASAMFYGWTSGSWSPGMMGPWMMVGPWSAGFFWSPLSLALTAMVIGLGVLGALWMNTSDLSRLRTGSTLVLIASVIAFPTMFGFMVGSLLMLIGGILGLTWQPATPKR
ncbi:MAG TPA: hypothetical protein VIH83_04665 [Candidatus Bathyarchaeia archaeon]